MRLNGVIIFVAVVGSACVPGNSPIRIVEDFQVDTACKVNDKISIDQGTLDASGAGTYVLDLDVDSDLTNGTQVDSTGMEIGGIGANNYVVEFLSLTYAAKDAMTGKVAGGAFAPEQIPITGTIPPLSTKNQIIAQILGPKAAAQLRTVVADKTQSVILTVGITLKGHMESGGALSSNTLSFPIVVTTTAQNCANGWSATGPCGTGGGQDGTVVSCLP